MIAVSLPGPMYPIRSETSLVVVALGATSSHSPGCTSFATQGAMLAKRDLSPSGSETFIIAKSVFGVAIGIIVSSLRQYDANDILGAWHRSQMRLRSTRSSRRLSLPSSPPLQNKSG